MNHTVVGRPFQTPGPQTETAHAHLLNCVLVQQTTAGLVDDERNWRRWESLTRNVTRSLRYGEERWWKMLCITVAILNMIRNMTGSQWNCCRAGVRWDCRSRPITSLSAEFWSRWRGESVYAGSLNSTELHMRYITRYNVINWIMVSRLTQLWIWRDLLTW